jgi:hypothetical protein
MSSSPSVIRVLTVDDHALLSELIRLPAQGRFDSRPVEETSRQSLTKPFSSLGRARRQSPG